MKGYCDLLMKSLFPNYIVKHVNARDFTLVQNQKCLCADAVCNQGLLN